MDDASPPPLHIVIFPWLAFGHMLPSLKLAERLAARGHRVSFVSTPRNISRLRPAAPAGLIIDFVALPFPRFDGLPEGTEATSDVPAGKLDLFYKAFDALAAPFSAFMDAACAAGDDSKVHLLMVDSFQYWAAAAARDREVPCVLSLVFSAMTLAEFGVPRVSLPPVAAGDAMPPSIPQRFALTFEKCKLVACRSCMELEPESIPLLSGIFGKPVIPFGLLPPSLPVEGHRGVDGGNNGETARALRWLDSQKPKSVLFVALGSEPPVTVEQLHELALGLELAGAPFLWALKRPTGVSETDDILPPGFMERTRGRGLVAMGWVAQLDVLAHGAVGAFLMHCGWGTLVEALVFGQPLIMLPFLDEHWINARLMERKQVGVQVPRVGEDKSFSREGVASSIGAVMSSEQDGGRVLAANAKKMQRVLVGDDKCQEKYIDKFIQFVRTHKES